MSREAIYAALFAKLQAVPGIVTSARKLRHWDDVPTEQQPALFVVQKSESPRQQTGLPAMWQRSLDIYIYARNTGAEVPAQVLNQILDNVEAALKPDNLTQNTLTLAGVAHYVRIDGSIETDEGRLGDQAVAIIPISIMAASGQ